MLDTARASLSRLPDCREFWPTHRSYLESQTPRSAGAHGSYQLPFRSRHVQQTEVAVNFDRRLLYLWPGVFTLDELDFLAFADAPAAGRILVQADDGLVVRNSASPGLWDYSSNYLPSNSRKRDFSAISARERRFDSSHASKSRIRTWCSTSGCLTTTVMVVWPCPMGLTQSAPPKAAEPRATAS
jgi:hypothetical protein